MKRNIFFALAILSFLSSYATVSLSDALRQKLITATFCGTKEEDHGTVTESSHWGPCISMEVTNNSAVPQEVKAEYGYFLQPTDTNVQRMMLTGELLVRLEAKQKKRLRLYAMCSQASNASPTSNVSFHFGKKVSPELNGLCKIINDNSWQNSAAQSAVWCMTDGHDVNSIYVDDTAMANTLKRYVAKYCKSIPVFNSPRTGGKPRIIQTFSGEFNYSLAKSAKVLIAIFDSLNHMKTVYVLNELQREGQYRYNYEISSEEMNGQRHYLRMFRDGRLEEEIVLLPHKFD